MHIDLILTYLVPAVAVLILVDLAKGWRRHLDLRPWPTIYLRSWVCVIGALAGYAVTALDKGHGGQALTRAIVIPVLAMVLYDVSGYSRLKRVVRARLERESRR